MIEAVFLDFYGTLVQWAPDAEEIQSHAAAAEGLAVDPAAVERAYSTANAYMDAENSRERLAARTGEARARFFAEYERRLLAAAGYDVDVALAGRIWARVQATQKELAPFDDALPALRALREAGLRLGVVSNMGRELGAILEQLGLAAHLDHWMSSEEAGVAKPHAAIFRAALDQAGVRADAALFVGDSFESDVLGAQAAGMQAALLLRDPGSAAPAGCEVVRTLGEVLGHARAPGLQPGRARKD